MLSRPDEGAHGDGGCLREDGTTADRIDSPMSAASRAERQARGAAVDPEPRVHRPQPVSARTTVPQATAMC